MLPDELTAATAHKVLSSPEWLEANRRYLGTHSGLDGDIDHWQSGDGFLGPKPSEGAPGRDTYMKQLKKVFITEDLISEVTQRRRKGVAGQKPTIEVAPLGGDPEEEEAEEEEGEEEEPSEADRIASLLKEWWTDRELTSVLGEVLKTVSSEERCVLRIIIDPGRLGESDQLEGADLDQALSAIRLEVLSRDQAAVHEDARTKRRTGIIDFEGTRGDLYYEEREYVEKTYVRLEDEMTVLRIEDETTVEPEEAAFDLGGRLLHKEVSHNLLLNESLRSNQADLNTTRTMINITGQKAGFPELHLVNVEPPEDEEGNPVEPERGPGRIQYHVSVPKKAQSSTGETEERQGTADVVETDPVDNESLRQDAVVARRSVYRSGQQLHVFMSDDATASGKSRIQARADFVNDLEDVAEEIDGAGEWICETAWHLAHRLVGAEPKDISVDFSPTIDPGPVSPTEKKQILAAYDKGVFSRHTTQLMLGIDDPDAEIERIREEQQQERVARVNEQQQFTEAVMERRQELEEVSGEVDNRESNRSDSKNE